MLQRYRYLLRGGEIQISYLSHPGMIFHKFSHSSLVGLFLGSILLLQGQPLVHADEPTVPDTTAASTKEETPPSAEDVAQFLQLARTINASNALLDVSVKNATLADVADRVHNTLSSPKALGTSAPRIEVRGVKPVRLSFAAKGRGVGATLNSSALLGEAMLWVCPGRLLLAPQNALTPQELADLKSGKMMEWRPTDELQRGLLLKFTGRKMLLAFVANELKKLNPQFVELMKGKSTPTDRAPTQVLGPPITLGQLSPTAQGIVLQMVDGYNDMLALDVRLHVDSSAIVSISPMNGGQLEIVQATKGQMEWTLNQDGVSFAINGPRLPNATSSPLVDLSAGKS